MKRTPLKPGNKPLQRKTPLKPGKKSLKNSGFKRPTLEEVKAKQKEQQQKPMSRKSGPSDKWMAKADRLWSRLVWLIYGGRCAMCGQPVPFKERHPHHMIPRVVKLFRHDPKNGMLFDGYCHNFADMAPHNSAEAFKGWLSRAWPANSAWLEENQGKIGSGKPDYEAICEDLKRLIEEWEQK